MIEKIYTYYLEMLGDCEEIPDELSMFFDSLEELQEMSSDRIIDHIKKICEKEPEKIIESMKKSWTSRYLRGITLVDTTSMLYKAFKHTEFF
jgi:hypothetical protein